MAYGTVKVDNITFTNGGIDQTVTVSGIVQSISGDITATGTIQGQTIIGTSTVSGATVTGDAGQFTTATAATGVFTSQISGATVTGNVGSFTTITGGTVTLTSGVFGAGTASLPSISFSSDPNTGIYSPGADQVAISTGGSGRLFVDASGNVGVGTAAPVSNSIHVFRASGYVECRAESGGNAAAIAADSSGSYVGNYSSIPLRFTTNSQERLRITSAGLVGIGTSAPSQLLHVRSATSGSGASQIRLENQGAPQYETGIELYSTPSTSTSAFRSGRLYSYFDGSAFADSRLTLQSVGNGDVLIDTLSVKNGQVGIGTTSPQHVLDVKGQSVRFTNPGGAIASLEIGDGATGNQYAYIDLVGDTTYTDYGLRVFRDNTGPNAPSVLYHRGTGALGFNAVDSGPISFVQGIGERARIDSSGRLLVGTSSASTALGSLTAKLQVQGTSAFDTGITNVLWEASTNPAQLQLIKSRGASIGTQTVVQNNDNLGRILFGGSDGTDFKIAAWIQCDVDGTPGANDMPGRLMFSTTADGASSPTERMRISANGTILFNTGTLGGDNGISLADGSNGARQLWWGRASTTATSYPLSFTNGGAGVGSISYTNTAVAYNTTSDYRLKENVTPVSDGITRLQQLKPSRFNFIADPDKTVDGFLAHEVQAIVPEAITGEKDAVDDEANPKYQGIDQSKLVPLLTAALQEAVAKIESLEARLTAAGI